MKKVYLITAFLDCCRLYTDTASEARAEPDKPRGLGPSSGVVQKLIFYACAPNAEAYDGTGKKNGNDYIQLNKLCPLRVFVVILHRNALWSITRSNVNILIYSISNHDRGIYGQPAQKIANSERGAGRDGQVRDQRCHCSRRTRANAGLCAHKK